MKLALLATVLSIRQSSANMWEDFFEKASEKKGRMYHDRCIIFFLLANALKHKDDRRIVLVLETFSGSLAERRIPGRLRDQLYYACVRCERVDVWHDFVEKAKWK